MAFGLETGPENVVSIKVVGVGGGGNNVVNRMVRGGAPQPLDEVKGEQGQDEMDKSFDEILRIFNKDKF